MRKSKIKGNGFTYTVTIEQIKQHQQLSAGQIFEWLDSVNGFLNKFQTPLEKEISEKIRKGEL